MTVGITELPPEGMQLGGVALAGDADRGTKTTEGLSLLFTTAGITVQGPQPQIERLLVWSGLDSASCREKIALPDGRNAAVMELTSGGQSIRFLLPMDTVTPGQAAYLDQALPAWLLRYKGPSGAASPATPPPAAAPPPAPSPPAASSPPPPAGPAGGTPPPPAAPSRESGPATKEPASGAAAAAGAAGVAAASASNGTGTNGTGRGAADPPIGSTGTSGPPASASFTPPEGSHPAPDLPPPPPSYAAPPTTGSVPPASGAPGSPATSSFPPPPPPPRAPGGTTGAGGNGWDVSTDPMPEGMAWDTPPMAEAAAGTGDREKKARGWRKGRSAAAGAAATAATAGSLPPPPDMAATSAFAPVEPPTQAPVDPVPLSTDKPLPPPPSEGVAAASGGPRPMLWKPPIDPATGEPAWDQSSVTPTKPAKKQRGWRKGANGGAVAAGAATAAGAAAAEGTASGAEGLGTLPAPPSTGAPSNGTPPTVAPPPPPPPPTVASGSTPPPTATDRDPDAPAPAGASGAPAKSNRNLVIVLLVVLLIVIGGIAYFAVKKSNTTTPTTVATGTTPATGTPSGGGGSSSAATALATSLNLRLTDLPNGWTRSPAPPATSPTGPLAVALNVAERNLSTCLGQPYGVVAGLFGDAPLPAAAGSADSPTFQQGTSPGVEMASTSSVQTTITQNQVLTGPFANPKFITCYAVYQTALASASAPGSVATVQTVTLPVPAGVTTWAFLTTITNPAKGTTQVEGEAYIFGGRDLTRLSPLTNGPPVPQGPFSMAYDAITARVAKALHR